MQLFHPGADGCAQRFQADASFVGQGLALGGLLEGMPGIGLRLLLTLQLLGVFGLGVAQLPHDDG